MFPIEGRFLGVLAALGVAFAMVILGGRLSEVADPTEPAAPPAITLAATPGVSVVHPDGEAALRLGGNAPDPCRSRDR
jgi:hypothetical protein